MCGIAGFVAEGEPDLAGRVVRAMLPALRRRGPDGEGVHSWPGATLGHRRLAIIDLSVAGAQPMVSADGAVGLVFNGCIYNFRELRAELVALGCSFHSECDTEVILEGYRAWGIQRLVHRIRGMFAFAIWDERFQKLFLVRDRLGVKPLVYIPNAKQIAFASTIDALRIAGLTGPVDPDAVLQFLEYGFVLDDSAIFAGVRKLPPATILEWRDGVFEEHCYWSLPQAQASAAGVDQIIEEAESLLVEAVRMRLIADVPLGALLSGGIDSTLICWAMAKLNANVTAFTVAVPGDRDDEASAAQRTARSLGIDHRVIPLPERSPALIDELIQAFSEPFAVSSALGMLLVSQAVQQAVQPPAKVLLTGDGGDDVFLGYPFMRNAWAAERFSRMLPSSAPAIWNAVKPTIRFRRVRSFLDYATTGLAGHARAHNGLPWFDDRALRGPRISHLRLEARAIPESLQSGRRLLTEVLGFHRKTHFTSEFMPKVDAGTMYHGIEARAPFLDQALWEFAAGLPYRSRLRRGELKAVLRAIVRKRVGIKQANRGKRGFSIPVERWLAGPWSAALACLEGPTLLEEQGWVAPGRLRFFVDSGKLSGAMPVQMWRLLILERWLRSRAPD